MGKKGKKSDTGTKSLKKEISNNNKILLFILITMIAFILVLSFFQNINNSKVKDNISVLIMPNTEIVVSVGNSINLNAVVLNDSNATFTWQSSDNSIATVNSGIVQGIREGNVIISATYTKNGKLYSASKNISVINSNDNISVTDVNFPNGELYMPINSQYQLSLTVTPPNAQINSKSFKTSNSNIVTVTDDGLVSAVSEGHSRIIVDVNNTYKRSIDVYVGKDYNKAEIVLGPSFISFSSTNKAIKTGTSEKLVYSFFPSNIDQSKLIWTSSDPNVVTVDDNGIIKGISEGVAIVSLSSMNGQRDDISVLVYNDFIEVSDILVSTNTLNMQAGTNQTITPTILPSNASNKTLGFISSDSEVVSVTHDANGASATLSALKAGTADVTISSGRVEKKITIVVTGESTNEIDEENKFPTNIRVRSDKNNLAKTYNEAVKIPVSGITNATVSMDIGVGKIKYCVNKYGSSLCTPNVERYSNCSIQIPSGGLYVLRIIKYDYDDNEISSTSSNYIDGVLNYYINTNEKDTKLKQYEIKGAFLNTIDANNSPFKKNGNIEINLTDKTRHLYVCYTKNINCTTNIRVEDNYKISLDSKGLWRIIVSEYDSNNNKLGKTEIYYASVIDSSNGNTSQSVEQKVNTQEDKSSHTTKDNLIVSNIQIANQTLIGKYMAVDVNGNDKFEITRFCYTIVDKGKNDVCKLDLTSNNVLFHNGAGYFHAKSSNNTYYAYFTETNKKTIWFDIDGLDTLYDTNNTKKDVLFSFAIGKKNNDKIVYSNPINIRINMTSKVGSTSNWSTSFMN